MSYFPFRCIFLSTSLPRLVTTHTQTHTRKEDGKKSYKEGEEDAGDADDAGNNDRNNADDAANDDDE